MQRLRLKYPPPGMVIVDGAEFVGCQRNVVKCVVARIYG